MPRNEDHLIGPFSFSTVDVEVTMEDLRRGYVMYAGRRYNVTIPCERIRIPIFEKLKVMPYSGKRADMLIIDDFVENKPDETDKFIDELYESISKPKRLT